MLSYRQINPCLETSRDLHDIARWYSDAKIRHLCYPHMDSSSYRQLVEPETLHKKILRKLAGQYCLYMVRKEGKTIGEFSVELGGGQLQKHRPKSAWVGLVIGEASCRGKGLGKIIMQKAERVAVEMGAKRVELGVFEFNHPAIALYEKMGYKTFHRIPRKTYWRGRFWATICMEKMLG